MTLPINPDCLINPQEKKAMASTISCARTTINRYQFTCQRKKKVTQSSVDMDIYFIFIAQKDKINGKVQNCIQDRNNRIMLLSQLWLW